MEAKAVVELILEEYPEIKFWVSFQCKVVHTRFFVTNYVMSGLITNSSYFKILTVIRAVLIQHFHEIIFYQYS